MGLGAGGQQPADPPTQSFSEPVPLTAELTKPPARLSYDSELYEV